LALSGFPIVAFLKFSFPFAFLFLSFWVGNPPWARALRWAALCGGARRIAAVQRALTDYGYAQLKPTGMIGADTQVAIQKFERERKLPVTGQVSDRLVRELAIVTGRPID